MKTKVLSLMVLAVFALSAMAVAQPGNSGKKAYGQQKQVQQKRFAEKQEMFMKMFTEEQREQMKKMKLETAKKVKPLRNELRELEARHMSLTTADKAEMGSIDKNIDKMADVKAEIAKIKAAQHQSVRSMLDEEQLYKFDQMHERRRGKGVPPGKRGGRNFGA